MSCKSRKKLEISLRKAVEEYSFQDALNLIFSSDFIFSVLIIKKIMYEKLYILFQQLKFCHFL